ncbi:MAG: hypothetical protein AABY39_07990 [Nitrospirota bacterium]
MREIRLSKKTTELSGKIVAFLIGIAPINLEIDSVASEVKTLKSSPNYPDVIPKHKIVKEEKRNIRGRDVSFLVKSYLPDVIIAEASIELENLLADSVLDFKAELIAECEKILAEYQCSKEFDEDYTVYCISNYSGDPEVFLSLHGEKVAALLKNERISIDENEVKTTLETALKYAKDDLTIVDWDGAFLFEPQGDIGSNIELFEIANLQLLKLRILDFQLDARLEKSVELLKRREQKLLFRSREVRKTIKEIVQIRTQTILESEAIEHNIKLIGDWYSARLYSLLSRKFHLDEWRKGINEKIDTLEDIYSIASENFTISLGTTLEFIIIAGWFALLIGYLALFYLEINVK